MTSSPTPAVLPDARARALRVLADVTEQMAPAGKYVARDILSGNLSPENERAIAAMFAYAKEAQPASDAAVPAGEVEALAQFLHDEGGFSDAMPDRTWPEHDGDTGQREGGWVKIVPSDVLAHFRDVARRWLLPRTAAAPKVASDTGAGFNQQLARSLEQALTDRSESRFNAIAFVHRHEIIAALATDATDGSTGGGEVLKRIRTSMALLQQHGEGCASNHYGGDFQMFGMPGWLIDTKADLDRFTDILATTPGGDLLEQAARVADKVAQYEEEAGEGGGREWSCALYIAAAIRALSARNQTDDGGEK